MLEWLLKIELWKPKIIFRGRQWTGHMHVFISKTSTSKNITSRLRRQSNYFMETYYRVWGIVKYKQRKSNFQSIAKQIEHSVSDWRWKTFSSVVWTLGKNAYSLGNWEIVLFSKTTRMESQSQTPTTTFMAKKKMAKIGWFDI